MKRQGRENPWHLDLTRRTFYLKRLHVRYLIFTTWEAEELMPQSRSSAYLLLFASLTLSLSYAAFIGPNNPHLRYSGFFVYLTKRIADPLC